jgi:hypothetical protein
MITWSSAASDVYLHELVNDIDILNCDASGCDGRLKSKTVFDSPMINMGRIFAIVFVVVKAG